MDSDSRKRPLDEDSNGGATKRSNQGSEILIDDNVQLKMLVPAIAAGAIIGKGGETIAKLQKDNNVKIKMSKNNDFYPGTNERICLITGKYAPVNEVQQFISEKIHEKPDSNPRAMDGDIKINLERHKQVKILVPNSTAGMIIGKEGSFIRKIQDVSGSFVQVSQKSKDLSLNERCITVAGNKENNNTAVEMILAKIAEDPQSGSCPTLSYAQVMGPVASTNPTGSPYANNNIGTGMNNLNLNSSMRGGNNQQMMRGPQNNVGMALDNMQATLRNSGYTDQATDEICQAMMTLANYNILGMGLGMGMFGNLGNFMGAMASGNMPNGAMGGGNSMGMNPSGGGAGNVFGPMGTTSTMGGQHNQGGQNTGSLFGRDGNAPSGESVFKGTFNNPQGMPPSGEMGRGNNMGAPINHNSFGLGMGMSNYGGPNAMGMDGGGEHGEGAGGGKSEQELQVNENLIGAILGPGGKGISELQNHSGAEIQISKRGVYAPGTRNRVVTITGLMGSVNRAAVMINQKVNFEETKRQQPNSDR